MIYDLGRARCRAEISVPLVNSGICDEVFTMTKIVDDFNLPYLLAREIWGASGTLNEIVPVEVHTAIEVIEKNGEFSVANLTDMMFDKHT